MIHRLRRLRRFFLCYDWVRGTLLLGEKVPEGRMRGANP